MFVPFSQLVPSMPTHKRKYDDLYEMPDEINEPYPPYVYIIRNPHAKEQDAITEVYPSARNALAMIKIVHKEGFDHDLEIVKPNRLVFVTPPNVHAVDGSLVLSSMHTVH
jgi:hypothetical protein